MKKILLFIGYAVTLIAADMNAMLLRTYQAARRPSLQRSAPVQRPRFFSSPTTVTGEQPIEQQKPDPKDLLQAKAKAVQLQRDNFGKSAEKSPWFNVFFQPERVAPLSQPIDSQPFAGQEEMQVLLEKLESEKNNVRSFYERASDFSNSYDTSLKSAAFNQKSSFQKAREIGLAEQWRDHKASFQRNN